MTPLTGIASAVTGAVCMITAVFGPSEQSALWVIASGIWMIFAELVMHHRRTR